MQTVCGCRRAFRRGSRDEEAAFERRLVDAEDACRARSRRQSKL